MPEKSLSIVFAIFLIVTISHAQSMIVDMDTASGSQPAFETDDTAQIITIQLRIASAEDLFSYECKVAFDTGAFTFVGAEKDLGIQGEKNILAKNSGTLVGICQLQNNPPAPDTVEFSFTITGSDTAKSVSGDGLIGVLYLKSKLQSGDSTTVTVSHGNLAKLDGSLLPVPSYTGGTYKVIPTVNVASAGGIGGNGPFNGYDAAACGTCRIVVSYQSSVANFSIPFAGIDQGKNCLLALYSLDGKLMAMHQTALSAAYVQRFTVPSAGNRTAPCSGACVCALTIGTTRFVRTIGLP